MGIFCKISRFKHASHKTVFNVTSWYFYTLIRNWIAYDDEVITAKNVFPEGYKIGEARRKHLKIQKNSFSLRVQLHNNI